MSGKQSRARRVEAVKAAKDGVYRLRGEGVPHNPFTDLRQRRIFDKYASKFREEYRRHEETLSEMQAVYGGGK